MNGRFLLDTNIVIAILEREASIIKRLNASIELYIPSIAMGELFYGAHHSQRVEQNLLRLTSLTLSVPILPCDTGTAESYGILKTELRKKGRPLPDNDIWIAAVAHQNRLTLVTRDAHFQQLASITQEIW